MKMLPVVPLLFLLAAGLSSTPAQADIVFGGTVGKSELDVDDIGFDDDDTGFKLFAGFRWFSVVGFEAQYADFGEFEDSGASIEMTSLGVFLVGSLPLSNWEIFGKLGYAYWDADTVVAGSSDDDTGTDFAFGGGVVAKFGEHFGIRGEYEVVKVEDTDDVTLTSIGIHIKL